MKKILSIMTAVSLAMTAMLSAVTVTAAEKITADEVRDMIYSTGLQSHPELWDKTIRDIDIAEDVLKPETRTVRDVIDINNNYREFYAEKRNGKYIINNDDNIAFPFIGANSDGGHVRITYFPDNYVIDIAANTAQYAYLEYYEAGLREDYVEIAKIINSSSLSEVKEIKIVNYTNSVFSQDCIYVKDINDKECAIPVNSYTDKDAAKLGREGRNLVKGQIMDFNEFCSIVEEMGKNMNDNWKENRTKYEEINGDEIRDTDTRAAYIGTESKFSDVSGDLVSYVNELNDLGIINGYDDNLFMPENTITRAEAAAMLTRMLRYSGKYNGEFKDVNADDWFADDVSALVAEGLINGYNDTTFAPYENIKYQEVMKILVYALGYGAFEMAKFPESYPSETNSKAMQIGLTNSLKSFDTTAPITRGDMAIMLSNALDTHLFTSVKMIPQNGIGGGMASKDITLIDYINGKKLNGNLHISQKPEN